MLIVSLTQLQSSVAVPEQESYMLAARLMAKAHSELAELQRTLRTANRRENTDAELSPAVTRLLHKAASHLRSASQVCLSPLQTSLQTKWNTLSLVLFPILHPAWH